MLPFLFLRSWKLHLLALALLGVMLCARGAGAASAPFPEFRAQLHTALLAQRGIDLDKNAFHFVILYTTMRTGEPANQLMRNVIHGLLESYLIGNGRQYDEISLAPYELHVRTDLAKWNQPFSHDKIGWWQKQIITYPENRAEKGGHDDEQALVDAVAVNRHPGQTIYIILSDAEASAPPSDNVNYPLFTIQLKPSDWPSKLNELALDKIHSDSFTLDMPDSTRGNQVFPATMFYQVFAPKNLTPLFTPILREDPTPPNPLWFLLILLPFLIYGAWLMLPRRVQVGGAFGTVQIWQKTLIKGGEEAGPNAIPFPDAPTGTRVSTLVMNGLGEIRLRGEGFYGVRCGRERNTILVGSRLKDVFIYDTRSKENNSYQVTIGKVK